MGSIEGEFEKAVDYVQNLPKQGPYKLSNDTKLQFYGLYKQATVGECTGKRPSALNFTERAKYDAWQGLGKTTKRDAMQEYVSKLKKIKSGFEDAAGNQGS